MSKFIAHTARAVCAAAVLAGSVLPAAAADVGVSLRISQPGVYGRVDIGSFPQPEIVYAQPLLVSRPLRTVRPAPVYMWVPQGHRSNWRRYCGQYGACGTPVYFVQDRWYDDHVRVRRVERPHGPPPGRLAR